MKVIDAYGRPIENLRIIVTTKCNYNCVYCHAEGYYDFSYFGMEMNGQLQIPKKYELFSEEVELIGKAARMFGVDKVKITGGEPLIKPDIADIVMVLKELGFRDVSMVTNGYFLADKALELKEAGLNRVNVSLVSLREDVFEKITRTKNALSRVIDGIRVAKEVGLNPIKINVVILKGFNEDEVDNFIEFAREFGVQLQLIEYHAPPTNKRALDAFFASLQSVEDHLRKIAKKIVIRRMHARPKYVLDGGVVVEVVRPLFNPTFCANCLRIRATPTGWKPCLLRNRVVNYEEELKNRDLRGLVKKFLLAIFERAPYFV